MSVISSVMDRSRTVLLVFVVILMMGVVAYSGIPVESQPDVSVPIIVVTVPLEGIAPEDGPFHRGV